LRDTREDCVIFNGSEGSVSEYVHVDNAGDLDKKRSNRGYVFTLAGGEYSCISNLIERHAWSTIEAEYIDASDASKEEIWLKD